MADWIVAQRKAFLRWANSHLKVTGKQIDSIQTGFKDGKLLCKLIALLTGDKVHFPNKKCKMEIHNLENINAALHYLTDKKGIRLVGIGAKDVYDGSEKLILGLLWTIILRLEISEFSIDGIAGKKGLLLWVQRVTDGYPKCGKSIKNFSGSWRNGLGFCAIINHFRSDCLDFDALDRDDSRACCDTGIAAATDLGIPALLETSDLVDTAKPDEKVVMTYVAEYFKKFAASEAAEAKVKAIKEAVALTMHHEKLLEEYNEGAAKFGAWVDAETEKISAAEPGISVEELEAQQAEFEKYLSDDKPAHQQELFKVESSLLSLQSSQRNNGRPIQEVSDEQLAPTTLNRKWETLCQLQGDFDRKISQLKNQYHQFNFMVSNFDAKADAVSQWIKDTLDNLQQVASEVDDSTANGLQQKVAAHARYATQVERYDSIIHDLKNVVDEVQPPYIDAQRIADRYAEVVNDLQELANFAEGYRSEASEALQQVEAVEKLVRDYCKTAENFAFEADTLTTRVGNQKAGDTEAVCEEQLASNADAASTVERLDSDYTALSEQAGQLDETGNSADIPPHLTLDVLEEKLNELKKLLGEKTAAVEAARDEARQASETRIEKLKAEHAGTTNDYSSQVADLQAWIAERSAFFQKRENEDFGTRVAEAEEKATALGEYRDTAKPEHLSKLYDLESMLGALRTSQSQNQLEVYEPPADQSSQALKDSWASLEEQEVAYDKALQQCIADYRSMKRATASLEAKANMIFRWIGQQREVFADDSEPSADRKAVLEARLGSYRKYAKQAGRYMTVAVGLEDIAGTVYDPYHTKDRVNAVVNDVHAQLEELQAVADAFAKKTQELLDAENALLAQAKEYKDAAEDLLFSLDEENDRVAATDGSASPKKSATAAEVSRNIAEHDERGAMLDREVAEARPNLQRLSDALTEAGREEYIPSDIGLDTIDKRIADVQAARDSASEDLKQRLEQAESEGSSTAAQLQADHAQQQADFEAAAASMKEWIAARQARFEGERGWISVEQCNAAVDSLATYRSDEKPTKQTELFGLEGTVGRLVSSQRQNNLPEYQPPADLTPAALISAWEALQTEEVSYEAELLSTLDSYTKMLAAFEEFTTTSDMILKWAEEKQAIFSADVDPAEEAQPPAVVLTNVNARLASHRAYTEQWSRYEPLKNTVVDVLVTKISEPYESAAAAAESHAKLTETLDALRQQAAEFGERNTALQQLHQADLELSQKHANLAEGTLFQLRLVRDDLNTPVNEASVQACEDAIAAVEEITNTKLSAISSTVDGDLATMHAELSAKPNATERQLLSEAHDNAALKQQVADLAATAEEQAARLKAALEVAREKEAAAKAFAEAADAFAAKIKALHASLAAIEGSPEERKSAILDVQTDVEARAGDVDACRELDDKCKELGVTSNTFTTETQHSVESLYESLVKLIASMLNEIEGQIAAASAGKLDPDTIKYVSVPSCLRAWSCCVFAAKLCSNEWCAVDVVVSWQVSQQAVQRVRHRRVRPWFPGVLRVLQRLRPRYRRKDREEVVWAVRDGKWWQDFVGRVPRAHGERDGLRHDVGGCYVFVPRPG